jgi:hypothetical protein
MEEQMGILLTESEAVIKTQAEPLLQQVPEPA